MHDLIIIGGGPAGIAAGVYASRKKLQTLFITKEWGGQSTVSTDIHNWIGTISLSGNALARNLEAHLRAYAEDMVTIIAGRLVTTVTKIDGGFSITLDDGSTHESKAVFVASGSVRRKLTAVGADVFDNKGLTYCASCDGPLFSGMDVAVIGGGNAAFETAAQLLAYTKSVTLLHRSEAYKADPVTVEKVLSHPHMKGMLNINTTEILGDKFVNGLKYTDQGGAEHMLPVQGIFVEIGLVPNTDCVAGLVPLDEYKRIKIDPWTQQTEVKGIWAAGDCTNIKYHQNNISAGDAVRALEDIYVHLKTK